MTPDAAAQVLIDLLAPIEGQRVLDLGCGTGRLSSALAALNCRVTALDRDPVVLEQARLAAPGAEFVCMDAVSYFPAEPFDAVAALGVLHWIEPLVDGTRLLARLVRAGGRAAGVCGGAGAPAVTASDLRSALRQAGFAEVEVEEYEDRLWFLAVLRGEADVA